MNEHSTPAPDAKGDGRDAVAWAVIVLAVAMQLVVAVPFTAGLGLVAPLWGIVLGWALWLASATALALTARRRPLLTPVVPVLNAGLLWALVVVGERSSGWTA